MTTEAEFSITKEQLANLDQLVCERFYGSQEQLKVLQSFECKNDVARGLVEAAKVYSSSDEKSTLAYYLVRDRDNVGYMFFSLRAGLLFDYEAWGRIAVEIAAAEEKKKSAEEAADIETFKAAKRTSSDLNAQSERLSKDCESETRDGIIRVKRTFGGIELVHFCKNDKIVGKWRSMTPCMGTPVRRMGEVLFWYFVVTKILEALKVIGAEVVYLFAADSTDDEKLRNYYRRLGFKRADRDSEYACLKDSWEWESFFMHRSVTGLSAAQEAYFRDFNQPVL